MPIPAFRPGAIAVLVFLCLVFTRPGRAAGSPSLEPIPEQAFSEEKTSPAPVEPAATEQSIAAPSTKPSLGETAFSQSLNAGPQPTPLYRQWLESILDLVASGDPYSRNKLVFTLGTTVGYDNNVLYSATNRIASPTYGIYGAIDYHFGSRRLKIDAKFKGGINYYENRPGGSNDQNYTLVLGVDYQLMPRLGLTFNTTTAYLSQPSPQFIGGNFQYSGSYFYTDTTVGLNYQWRPRLGITASYEVNEFKYDNAAVNQSSGFFQQTFSLGANWLFSPRTSFTLQYRYNPVVYNQPGSGSVGNLLLVGINQSLTERLNYSLNGGAEYRQLENQGTGNSSYLGPFVEGTLSYNFTPDSALNGTMRFGTEPSGSDSVRTTFRTAFGVEHKLGYGLTLGGNLGFERDTYAAQSAESLNFTQDFYTVSVDLRYEITLATSLVADESYSLVNSSLPNTSYTRNYLSLGVEVDF